VTTIVYPQIDIISFLLEWCGLVLFYSIVIRCCTTKNKKGKDMGCYVNPKNEDKESFLDRVGERIKSAINYDAIPVDKLLVVLVDNGLFTAAAVAYCKEEFMEFTKPTDFRPKLFFLVDIEDLKENSDIDSYLKR
jgi:hypothetical protein